LTATLQSQTARNHEKTALVKDGLSYLFSAACVAASGGAAALAQPGFRLVLNMLHGAQKSIAKDSGSFISRFGAGLTGMIKSLKADVTSIGNALTQFFRKPLPTLKKHLLSESQAPKTWGHIGALVGGLVGGLTGGPILAGVGFLAGRYAGQALGRLLSFATNNTSLTFGQTAKQALFAGFAPITPTETNALLNKIDQKIGPVKNAIQARQWHTEGGRSALTSQRLESDRQEILRTIDTLENNVETNEPLTYTNDHPELGRVIEIDTLKNYCQAQRCALALTMEEAEHNPGLRDIHDGVCQTQQVTGGKNSPEAAPATTLPTTTSNTGTGEPTNAATDEKQNPEFDTHRNTNQNADQDTKPDTDLNTEADAAASIPPKKRRGKRDKMPITKPSEQKEDANKSTDKKSYATGVKEYAQSWFDYLAGSSQPTGDDTVSAATASEADNEKNNKTERHTANQGNKAIEKAA
jgi:hypothetical protein